LSREIEYLFKQKSDKNLSENGIGDRRWRNDERGMMNDERRKIKDEKFEKRKTSPLSSPPQSEISSAKRTDRERRGRRFRFVRRGGRLVRPKHQRV